MKRSKVNGKPTEIEEIVIRRNDGRHEERWEKEGIRAVTAIYGDYNSPYEIQHRMHVEVYDDKVILLEDICKKLIEFKYLRKTSLKCDLPKEDRELKRKAVYLVNAYNLMIDTMREAEEKRAEYPRGMDESKDPIHRITF